MIKWENQCCGVHQATYSKAVEIMPDVKEVLDTFPENVEDFVWDIKVHMLMPNQYPCIPNWHFDNIPRVNNKQDFSLVTPDAPMYLWISNEPLTEFKKGGYIYKIKPQEWKRFTQLDEHRGTESKDFQWRGFIRATHKDIFPMNKANRSPERLHTQVYLDANNFKW